MAGFVASRETPAFVMLVARSRSSGSPMGKEKAGLKRFCHPGLAENLKIPQYIKC